MESTVEFVLLVLQQTLLDYWLQEVYECRIYCAFDFCVLLKFGGQQKQILVEDVYA